MFASFVHLATEIGNELLRTKVCMHSIYICYFL